MTYKAFGQKLKRLRQAAQLKNQEQLAELVDVSSFRIVSRWESGKSRPNRDKFIQLVEIFAARNCLDAVKAQTWALQAGYELSRAEAQSIFPGHTASPTLQTETPAALQQRPTPPDNYTHRNLLERTIEDFLFSETRSTLVLTGPGGSGKTTLVRWAVNTFGDQFSDGVLWLDCGPQQSVSDLQTQLAQKFDVNLHVSNPSKRAEALQSLFYQKRCLLVLDDLWATDPHLAHLRVNHSQCPLLVTTRDKAIAHLFEAVPPVEVGSMTVTESKNFFGLLAGSLKLSEDQCEQLAEALGRLPLALAITGALLHMGYAWSDLLHKLQSEHDDPVQLEIDLPGRSNSLNRTFDLSYQHLRNEATRRCFAQSGVFTSFFDIEAAAQVWDLPAARQAQKMVQELVRFSLVEHHPPHHYRLHTLLAVYARQRLQDDWPALMEETYRRHAAYYILHKLAHPQVVSGVNEAAPALDDAWGEVVAAVRWASNHAPELAMTAALLAHTERPALLEAVGPGLIDSLESGLAAGANPAEQALWQELRAELHLLDGDEETAAAAFEQSARLWLAAEDSLASSRAKLRLAGVQLLRQNQDQALRLVVEARQLLAHSLPLAQTEQDTADRLFYWFNLIYNVLIKAADLPESEVTAFAALAEKTGDPALMARGWHIYRLWCTAQPRPYSRAIYEKARLFGAKAAWCWRRCGQTDQARAEVMWVQEYTRWRRSRRLAEAFVRRRAAMTPYVSDSQIARFDQSPAQLWLKATTIEQRLKLLVDRLPLPGSDDEAWEQLNDILNVGIRGEAVRRFVPGRPRPAGHFLSEPMWRVLSGQRTQPLTGATAEALVARLKERLADSL